jgi:hypothetical protein
MPRKCAMYKQIIISATAVINAVFNAPTALPPAEQLGDYATSCNLTTSSHLGLNVLYEIAALPLTEQFGNHATSHGLEFGEKAKSVSHLGFTKLSTYANIGFLKIS